MTSPRTVVQGTVRAPGWGGPLALPRAERLWRGPDTVVVVAVWLLLTVQQLAVSLSRPKEFVPITAGGPDVPAWAATVTTGTNAGVVLLAAVVAVWQLRRAPWGRWGVLLLALAPWLVVVVRLVMLDRPPSALALVYPAVVVALWFARPRLAVVEVLGYLTIATATISIALGVLVPSAGIYVRAAGAELEKPIGPFGVLAGNMLSGNDLGLVLVVGLAAVWTVRRTVVRWGGLGLVVVAIVWSASRTALLALAVVLVLGVALRALRAVLSQERAASWSGWLAGGALGGLLLVVVILPLVVHADAALNNRGRLWGFAVDRFAEQPVLGAGADVFKVLATGADNLGGHASHAHNLAAQVLVSGGVVLVVAVGALLGAVIYRAVRLAAQGWDWPALFGAAFLVCAALEVPIMFTDRIRQFPFVAVPLLLVLFAQPLVAAARSRSSSSAV